jgi:hypothetical protein
MEMQCRVLRCLGKNFLAVQLDDSEAIVTVQLGFDTDSHVIMNIKNASISCPIPATVVLGEYYVDKHYFACKYITLKSVSSMSAFTTKYRRVDL